MKKQFSKLLLLAFTTILPQLLLSADDGPRMYWNAPVGTNILQTYYWSVNGNSITPEGTQTDKNLEADIGLGVFGYNRIFDIAGASTILTGIITAGDISSTISNETNTIARSSRGLGDIYLQGVINLIGAPALTAQEFGSYQQSTVISLLVGVTAPTGDYESSRLLNMGANRWNLRLGIPMMQTIGEWKAGEITTIEILPSVWFYGENGDSFGMTIEQDPLYTLEVHITQDITTTLFASLDYFVQRVGRSYTNGVETSSSNISDTLGLTVGYMINPQMQLQLRYASALNPNPMENELDADMFQLNFNYFW